MARTKYIFGLSLMMVLCAAVIDLEHAFPIGVEKSVNSRSLVTEQQGKARRNRKRDLAARRAKATWGAAEARVGDRRMIDDGGSWRGILSEAEVE